jgi:hypothetical protein
MKSKETRAKVATTLRAMQWKPKQQGGNGRPLPIPQILLAAALGWDTEVAVPTRQLRDSGYPTCYKIDIANADLHVGIEVDGPSHYSRRSLDQKKDEMLALLGWTILRFSNKAVMTNLNVCVQEVLSTISKLRERKHILQRDE